MRGNAREERRSGGCGDDERRRRRRGFWCSTSFVLKVTGCLSGQVGAR
ncbi:hypothetical protein MSMEI_4370 [Mycolicibacterium smegmatis MC2 155]|uniref:Uncharacterized protein n=2 Tax=Mycolicibacterium smegmatis (strain ATCC 700084 / mc(2)155) TaxID=246196 RepID=A0R0R5_MYCS2|nr:hypothetical protein MSMEG_4481 [Mycolicibacterium smegmatis MC2 155]AFP40824.1 hypothetical protein MSMEI_4370 [Mycolicibacterium smegmatis MC2 155]